MVLSVRVWRGGKREKVWECQLGRERKGKDFGGSGRVLHCVCVCVVCLEVRGGILLTVCLDIVEN